MSILRLCYLSHPRSPTSSPIRAREPRATTTAGADLLTTACAGWLVTAWHKPSRRAPRWRLLPEEKEFAKALEIADWLAKHNPDEVMFQIFAA
jgi:hypothetical protein